MFEGLLFEPELPERKERNEFRNHFPTKKMPVQFGKKCNLTKTSTIASLISINQSINTMSC